MNFSNNKSTRIYLGKINNLKKTDIQSVVYQFGNVKDFLMKDTYAFVVDIIIIFFLTQKRKPVKPREKKLYEKFPYFYVQEYSNEFEAQQALVELDGKIIYLIEGFSFLNFLMIKQVVLSKDRELVLNLPSPNVCQNHKTKPNKHNILRSFFSQRFQLLSNTSQVREKIYIFLKKKKAFNNNFLSFSFF